MKDISREEFEQYIMDMIDGKITQTQAVEELQTDHRTLQNEIQKLMATNPELHKRFVESRPYKPKARSDISAMELVLEVLKEEKTLQQIADSYGAGMRTVRRRLDSLKKSEDPFERELFQLTKEIAYNHSHSLKHSVDLQNRISKAMEILKQTVSKEERSSLEIRRQELLQIEKEYNELCQTMTKMEAAKKMGYTTNRLYKLLNELYRIEIERGVRKNTERKESDFKKRIKVEGTSVQGQVEETSESSKHIKKPAEEKLNDHEETEIQK